jgi:hypothetical protein
MAVFNEMAVKPEVVLLEDLLREVLAGSLRIPRFQRPFVWRPEQMLDLFDSIERGYPIGSLLVWDTDESIPSLDFIAGLALPEPPPGRIVSYVLDGHQRLSTLFGALMRPVDAPRSPSQSDWMWWIYRALISRDSPDGVKFRHWKQDRRVPSNYLPVRSTLRTMDFLAFARSVEGDLITNVDELIDEAEQVAQRIKSYKLSVVRLVGGSLGDAVEVFSRLNSRGQPMTPDQMVSALAYKGRDDDTLAERIENILETLAPLEFGDIASITVFRSILAVAGEDDVQEARWDALARRLYKSLDEAADRTERAIYYAVRFLQNDVGVPLARLVPYNAQIMLLTAFFAIESHPSRSTRQDLARWFWATSWSGWFAGANSTQIKIALQDMRYFAEGQFRLRTTEEALAARGFPERFDTRSARVRAFLIWDLKAFPQPISAWGERIDKVRAVQREDTRAYRHIISGSRVSNSSSPANRLVLPTNIGESIRTTLLNLSDGIREDFLKSSGIPRSAFEFLRAGDASGFIDTRARFLAAEERKFMLEWGVEVPPGEAWDSAEVDTE